MTKITAKQITKAILISYVLFMSLTWLDMYKNRPVRAVEFVEDQKIGDYATLTITPQESQRSVKKIEPSKKGGWSEYISSLALPSEKENWLRKIIQCESRGNPNAINSQHVIVNGVDYGQASGLGQFLVSSWERGEKKYLKREADIFDQYDQVDMLIAFYDVGQQHEWVCNFK